MEHPSKQPNETLVEEIESTHLRTILTQAKALESQAQLRQAQVDFIKWQQDTVDEKFNSLRAEQEKLLKLKSDLEERGKLLDDREANLRARVEDVDKKAGETLESETRLKLAQEELDRRKTAVDKSEMLQRETWPTGLNGDSGLVTWRDQLWEKAMQKDGKARLLLAALHTCAATELGEDRAKLAAALETLGRYLCEQLSDQEVSRIADSLNGSANARFKVRSVPNGSPVDITCMNYPSGTAKVSRAESWAVYIADGSGWSLKSKADVK